MIDNHVLEYSNKLKVLKIEHSIVEHPNLAKVEDVLKYCKLTYKDGASTLVFKVDEGYISVIRRDDCKINLNELQKLAKTKLLRMATNEEFTALTGLEPGAARIYIPEVMQTFIDEKVMERSFVQAGSGSFTCSIQYQTKDLSKIPNSTIVSLSEFAIHESAYKSNRVFSGIRATGRLHLGNYLGAVKGFLELQNKGEYEMVYCVVDVHSITTPYDKTKLADNKRNIMIDYLAAGLDPNKSILIYQSEVPEVMELSFYFSSVMSIARMQHLPTFKEKVKQHPQGSTMALLNYPILMAADILIYKAGLVPVGIDQEPHLEVAREIARKMNEQYGMDFPEPVRFATKGEYIPSLKGEGKMSKSVEGSYINLTDSLEQIRKKVALIPTDSGKISTDSGKGFIDKGFYISKTAVQGGVHATTSQSGVKNLMIFVELFQGLEKRKYYENLYQTTGLRYKEVKEELSLTIYKDLKPLQEKRKELEASPEYVDKVIRDGAAKAKVIAQKTVDEVKKKMGLS